ncbi:Zinc finger and BTB domain-containing protein 6 [Eufriesea mexicana]|nr:Zinc finger and BTB domain-containing protein 6 [Eufriesea mexicana]
MRGSQSIGKTVGSEENTALAEGATSTAIVNENVGTGLRDSMPRFWKMLKDLEDGPPFLCPKCGRTYSHKCNLTRHLRLECGVGPRFQCAWCKKRFKHRHHLRDHQRIHLYSNCTFELRN